MLRRPANFQSHFMAAQSDSFIHTATLALKGQQMHVDAVEYDEHRRFTLRPQKASSTHREGL